MAKTKALCIFSGLLGNASMARTLVRTLDRLGNLDPTYVIVSNDDYGKYPAPWWARLSDPWHAEYIARQKTRAARQGRFDILWLHGWEGAVAFGRLARSLPAAVTLDSVPATMDRQLRQRGVNSLRRTVAHQLHDRAFRAAVPRIDCWLPMASDCARSLERDYGVDPGRSVVTLTPQDTAWWAPPARSFRPPWRALFVGNHFDRKGGEFLLRLFAGQLPGACTLTILSNDPSLQGRALPPGVNWIRGAAKEQVREAYWNHHLLLLPTRQDFAPQVLAEAAAAGLPAIASDVGGIPDLLQNNETGFVLPRDASLEDWAGRMRGLFAQPEALERMSAAAQKFAAEFLSLERFERLVAGVVARLEAAR